MFLYSFIQYTSYLHTCLDCNGYNFITFGPDDCWVSDKDEKSSFRALYLQWVKKTVPMFGCFEKIDLAKFK